MTRNGYLKMMTSSNGDTTETSPVSASLPFRISSSSVTYQWDASVGDYVPVDKTDFTYVYDLFTGEKFVVGRIYTVWDGSAYANEERVTYTFGDPLVYSSSQTDTWNGISWEPAERETITEEDAGVG